MANTETSAKADEKDADLEPISVYPQGYPKNRPPVSVLKYNFCQFLFLLGNFLTMMALVLL
jgi:hypothetical protein